MPSSLVPIDVSATSGEGTVAFQGVKLDGSPVKRQLARITRGLFYHRFRTPLPEDCPTRACTGSAKTITGLALLAERHDVALSWIEVEPGVFCYCHATLEENEKQGFVVMVFFDKVFLVFHGAEVAMD